MKKWIGLVAVVLIVTVGVFLYIGYSTQKHSFSTPEKALGHLNQLNFPVGKRIQTTFFDNGNTAYIAYYSKVNLSNDYLVVSMFRKNEHGWRFEDEFGVGQISADNAGNSSGSEGTYVGFAKNEVEQVRMGTHEAAIIPLEGRGVNAWLFHGLDADEIARSQREFLDHEGRKVSSY